jgi:LuxR family maltose regulon positive regulatory protein
MGRTTPSVSAGAVYDPTPPATAIPLDTPAWFAWLDRPTTARFAYPLYDPAHGYIVGVMTVRKERRQRGGWYWTAYRRAGTRLRKAYLGRSALVTQARLEEVAAHLRATRAPD